MRASLPRNGALRREFVRLSIALACALVALLLSSEARAYTWMIRHEYAGCATCHLDPSGGGVLTPYGRAVGGLVLDTQYVDRQDDDEGSKTGEFMLGLVPLPPELMLGGDLRLLYYTNKVEGVASQSDLFIMQADFEAAVSIAHVLASASIGYAETGAFAAAITDAPEKNLVSRIHWAGYEFHAESGLIARLGRMNLPFGIRNVEHTLWARSGTATSVNADQQTGLAVAWSPAPFRAELMGIFGNFQISPDDYRERGYSGYLEWVPLPRLGVGASSLITHRDLDPEYLKETWRHAHGVFARFASFDPLVVLAELDYVLRSPKNDFRRSGVVGYLQADVEPIQGLHFAVTGEVNSVGLEDTPPSWGLWVSQLWFVAPHLDLRLDNVYQSLGDEFGRTGVLTLLAQAHLYL
jgi:hypothetical protein